MGVQPDSRVDEVFEVDDLVVTVEDADEELEVEFFVVLLVLVSDVVPVVDLEGTKLDQGNVAPFSPSLTVVDVDAVISSFEIVVVPLFWLVVVVVTVVVVVLLSEDGVLD